MWYIFRFFSWIFSFFQQSEDTEYEGDENKNLEIACDNLDVDAVIEALKNGAEPSHMISGWKKTEFSSEETLSPLEISIKRTTTYNDNFGNSSAEDQAKFAAGLEIIKQLLQSGANPRGTKDYTTTLHDAVDSGCFEIAKVLLDHEPSLIKEVDESKYTPLHVACGGYGAALGMPPELIILLISRDPSLIDAKDEDGMTPARRLCECSSIDASMKKRLMFLKILIQNGADLSIADNNGLSPLSIAQHRKDIRDAILESNYQAEIPIAPKVEKIFFDDNGSGHGEDGELYLPLYAEKVPSEVKSRSFVKHSEPDKVYASLPDISQYKLHFQIYNSSPKRQLYM